MHLCTSCISSMSLHLLIVESRSFEGDFVCNGALYEALVIVPVSAPESCNRGRNVPSIESPMVDADRISPGQ